MKIFIVNGEARSGKDTFVKTCQKVCEALEISAYTASSVDMVKKAAILLGWNGEKDEAGRSFLSDLKDLSTAAYDGPMQYMEDCMRSRRGGVWFFQIREPEEIEKFVRKYPMTQTILIRRPGNTEKFNNHADREVEAYHYDHEIINCDDVDRLRRKALQFVNEVIYEGEFEFVQNPV